MLLDGQIDVLAGGHLHHGALQRVLVPLQPLGHQNGGGILTGQALELGGGAAGLLDLDHVARLDQIGGDIHPLAVDGEVAVAHQLTGLTAGHGEAQTVHHVVQTALHEGQQILTGLALLKLEIHMEELKKKYTPYTESERMSYIREYLSTSETKSQFAKRTGICRRLLILWLDKYHINDKVMSTEQPSLRKDSDESLNELEKELAALRAENRKLQRALQEESLRHEACEKLINLAESTYHIKVRKNSDAK